MLRQHLQPVYFPSRRLTTAPSVESARLVNAGDLPSFKTLPFRSTRSRVDLGGECALFTQAGDAVEPTALNSSYQNVPVERPHRDIGKAENDVDFMLARSQHFSQELYETRIASLQRFVSMTAMIHQIGKRVQEFFAFVLFGMLGYRMTLYRSQIS
jgi:hypothetical protein